MGQDGILSIPVKSSHFTDSTIRKHLNAVESIDFAVLNYVEGQKYTIGGSYKSREDQGEFIYLPSPEKFIHGVPTSVVEILCENDKFWVAQVDPEQKLLVCHNNIYLDFDDRRQLNFGDSLSITMRKPMTRSCLLMQPFYKLFTFEKRNLSAKKPEEEEGQAAYYFSSIDNVAFAIGQNMLIVSQILSYLNIDSLKIARLVSTDWSREALRFLKPNAATGFSFNFSENLDYPKMYMRPFQYIQEMKDLPISSWSLSLPRFLAYSTDPKYLDPSEGKLGAKLMVDLDWFLLPKWGHRVKRLVLLGDIASLLDYKVHTKILASLQETLEELELSFIFRNSTSSQLGAMCSFADVTNLHFEKLQTFILSFPTDGEVEDFLYHGAIFVLLKPVAAAMKKVKSIQLLFCMDDLTTTFFNNMKYVRNGNGNGVACFTNLQELAFHFTTPEVLKFLRKLDRPLKKLELHFLADLEASDFHSLYDLLLKHVSSLETLQFILSESPWLDTYVLRLPILPKLKNLWVGWDNGSLVNGVPISFIFGTEMVLNYARNFPSLQSLSLWPMEYGKYPRLEHEAKEIESINQLWEECGQILRIFFPAIVDSEGRIVRERCETLRVLDMPLESDGGDLFTGAGEIVGMFPNVHSEVVNKIRRTTQQH